MLLAKTVRRHLKISNETKLVSFEECVCVCVCVCACVRACVRARARARARVYFFKDTSFIFRSQFIREMIVNVCRQFRDITTNAPPGEYKVAEIAHRSM